VASAAATPFLWLRVAALHASNSRDMNWQLKTILWLRWRLTRNSGSAGGFGAVLAVIVAVSAVVLCAATFVGGLLGAALGWAKRSRRL
jgi:hypothetical protein